MSRMAGPADQDQATHAEAGGELYRLLLDAVGQAVIATEPDGTIVYWNRSAETLYGWSKAEAVGRSVIDLTVPEDGLTAADEVMDCLRAGQQWSGEFLVRRRDGTTFPAQVTNTPLHDEMGRLRAIVGVSSDISERKRAEVAIQESREQLELALQAADMGQWELNVADGTASRNLRHDQLFGFESLLPEWTYDMFLEHVVPEDREAVDSRFRQAMASGEPWESECRIRRMDGALRWIWAKGRLFRDEQGRSRRMVGMVADITERKQTEKELRDARTRLQAALDAGAISTWNWDIRGNRFYSDRNLARLFSIRPEDDAGVPLEKLLPAIHPDDRPRVEEAVARSVESGGDYEQDYRVMPEPGTVRWVVARGRVEYNGDGRPLRMAGVLVDITDRKQAEEDARQRAEEAEEGRRILDAVMRHVPEGITVADAPDVKIRLVSQHGIELVGRSPETLLGGSDETHPETWGILHADGITPATPEQLPLTRAVRQGQVVTNEEWVLCRPDGSRVPILCNAGPIRDAQGTVVGGIIAWRDISDRKRIEDELREADRRKNEFLAMLAHELRNPLAPIRTGLEVIALEADGRNETIELMQQQVSHLVRLVDDLLDVSRIIQGRIELRRDRVELSALVRRSVNTILPTIQDRNQELTVTLPQQPVWLDVDPVRLVQVIGNLLANASKYTDEGKRIELVAEQHDGAAVIGVRDEGIGIEPDLLPKVFDLFTQASRSLDRSQGGLGIGLTLVKNLVEMHGGSVAARSEGLGRGSRFEVRLPTTGSAKKSEPRPGSPATTGSRRVLVVDDNVAATKMLSLLVSRLGPHEVETAHDGPSAIDLAAAFQPDIILLDIGLPGMDGLEVARKLREDGRLAGTLLVALTGYGQEEDRQRSREAGFDEHLVKPVDVETLRQLLCHPKLSSKASA